MFIHLHLTNNAKVFLISLTNTYRLLLLSFLSNLHFVPATTTLISLVSKRSFLLKPKFLPQIVTLVWPPSGAEEGEI